MKYVLLFAVAALWGCVGVIAFEDDLLHRLFGWEPQDAPTGARYLKRR